LPSYPKHKKQEVIQFAKNNSLVLASQIFDIAYTTIQRWLNVEDFPKRTNKHLKDSKHPNKLPDDLYDKIVHIKKENPHITARQIKDSLNLKLSIQTINKKLRQSDLKTYKSIADDSPYKPLHHWILVGFKLPWEYQRLPVYQFIAYDLSSRIYYTGFSNTKSDYSVTIFIDYVISYIKRYNEADNIITVYTNKGQEFVGYHNNRMSNFLDIVQDKHKGHLSHNLDKKLIKMIFNRLIYNNHKFTDLRDMMLTAYADNLHYNHFKRKAGIGDIEKKLFNLPVLLIDNHFSDFQKIIDYTDYWQSNHNSSFSAILATGNYFKIRARQRLEQHNIKEAISDYETSLSLATIINHYDNVIDVITTLCRLWLLCGDLQRALFSISEIEKIFNKVTDPLVRIRLFREKAVISFYIGDYSAALKNIHIYLTEAEKCNQNYYITCAFQDMAKLHHAINNYHLSKEYLYKAARTSEINEHRRLDVLQKIIMTDIDGSHARFGSQLSGLNNALIISKENRYYDLIIECSIKLAQLYIEKNQKENATSILIYIIKIIWLTGYRSYLPVFYHTIVIYYLSVQNYGYTEEYVNKMIYSAEKSGAAGFKITAYENLVRIYSESNKQESALKYALKAFLEMLTLQKELALSYLTLYIQTLIRFNRLNEASRLTAKYQYLSDMALSASHREDFRIICRKIKNRLADK